MNIEDVHLTTLSPEETKSLGQKIGAAIESGIVIALIGDLGAGKTIDSNNIKDPVVGFIFGSKGLMYNLTLEGSKFSKLDKSE